jgi:hypothetical protein
MSLGKLPDFAVDAIAHVLAGEFLFGGRLTVDLCADCRSANVLVWCIGKRDRQLGFVRRSAAQPVGRYIDGDPVDVCAWLRKAGKAFAALANTA